MITGMFRTLARRSRKNGNSFTHLSAHSTTSSSRNQRWEIFFQLAGNSHMPTIPYTPRSYKVSPLAGDPHFRTMTSLPPNPKAKSTSSFSSSNHQSHCPGFLNGYRCFCAIISFRCGVVLISYLWDKRISLSTMRRRTLEALRSSLTKS
jgi:hypothetical protein